MMQYFFGKLADNFTCCDANFVWSFNVQSVDLTDVAIPLLSTIVGAIIAAVTANKIANRTSVATLERDSLARIALQKSNAIRATLKIQKILNSFFTIKNHIDTQKSEAKKFGHESLELWLKVTPLIGIVQSNISFDVEELVVLIETKEYELLDMLLNLADRHASFEAGMIRYSSRRLEVTDRFGATAMAGTIAVSELPDTETKAFAAKSYELESLIVQLERQATECLNQAISLGSQFSDVARKYFDDSSFPKLVMESGRHDSHDSAA